MSTHPCTRVEFKHSMGSIDCLTVSGAEAKILKRLGSGFLISEGADFVTAAHVVRETEKGDDPCPAPAITMAVGNWRPEAPAEDMLWSLSEPWVAGLTALPMWRHPGRVEIPSYWRCMQRKRKGPKAYAGK
jgi:hypothetical protein